MDIDVDSLILPSGLTLVHMKLPDTPIVKIQMTVRGGFYQQLEEHVGYAHAVEHMLSFYTSDKYPSAQKNKEELSRLGINGNAWTSIHSTGYWLTGLDTHFPFMLDLMLQTFLHPRFDKTKFKTEKEAVKKELDRIINGTWYGLDTKVNDVIYNNTNVAVSTQDEKTNIERLTLSSLADAHDRFYILPNMVFTVVSSQDSKKVFDDIKKLINVSSHADPTYYKLTSLLSNPYSDDVIFVPNKHVDNYRIQFVIRTPFTLFDPRVYILHVLDRILTDGLSSRLYEQLRDKLGAVYFVSGYPSTDPVYPELSNYNIVTETTADRVLEVVNAIEDVLSNIKNNKRLREEIEEYHNKLTTANATNELSRKPEKYTNAYLSYILWNEHLLSRREQQDLLYSVTADDVAKLSDSLFTPENVVVFYSGKSEL